MNFIFLIFSLLLLIFVRQLLINLLFKITGPNWAKNLYFLLFFPGVIIHELSHFFTASILFVPTGEISLFPEEKRIGSIKIAKTDPIREAIIGLAPMIIGTLAILGMFSFPLNFAFKAISIQALLSLIRNPRNLLWLYLIFVINNTMFASESDRRSWLGILALIVLVGSSLYLFGILPSVAGPLLYYANLAANQIAFAYLFTFLINLVFIIPLFLIQKIVEKIKMNPPST